MKVGMGLSKVLLGFVAGAVLAAGALTIKDVVAAPGPAPAASQPSGRLADTDSPHGQAIALVLATQQKAIRDIEKQAGTLRMMGSDESWWFDTARRSWSVVRPFAPGYIDSTHMFTVRYAIDGNEVAAWDVDTVGRKVTPAAREQATSTPASAPADATAKDVVLAKALAYLEKNPTDTSHHDMSKPESIQRVTISGQDGWRVDWGLKNFTGKGGQLVVLVWDSGKIELAGGQ